MKLDKRNRDLVFLSLCASVSLVSSSLTASELDFINGQLSANNSSAISSVSNQSGSSKVAKLDTAKTIEKEVNNHFEQAVSKIDNILFTQQKKLINTPSKLYQFVNSELLPLWNSERTLKLLLGASKWKALTANEIDSLNRTFDQTMRRYINEGMKFYDGQRIKLVSVNLNKKQTKGIVTIEISPIYLPAFKINFKISKSNDQWLLYDILVEGISYVKMKKNEYRRIVEQQGVDELLAYLDEKNMPRN